MKKTFNFFLVALIGSLLLMSSCKKSSSTFSVIPKSTQAVMVIDIKSVFKKADFLNIEDYSFFNTAMKEMKSENKKVARILEEFIEKPTVSGINLFEDMFIYYVNEADDEQFTVFALPLKDGDKFGDWIDDFFDATDEDYDIEKAKNYKYMIFEEKVGIAWNDDVVIFISPIDYNSEENIDYELEYLMSLDKDDQISENKAFTNFYSNKKDISFWMDYELLSEMDEYEDAMDMMDMNFDDMDVSVYLDFLDGEIKLTTTVNIPDDNKMMKIYDAKFNGDVLDYSSKQSLAIMSYALNMEALADYLKSIPTIDDANDEVEQQIGYSIDEIINSFGGSILINITDFDKKEVEYTDYEMEWNEYTYEYEYNEVTKTKDQMIPLGVAVLDLNTTDVLDDLLEMISESGAITEHNDYYEFEDDGMTYYFGYNSDIFVFTLDKEAIKQFTEGGYSSSLASLDEGKSAKDNISYMKVNLNLDDYPSFIVDKITDGDEDVEKIASYWNDTFDFIEFKMGDKKSAELSIVLKDKKENSLTFLLHTLDDISKKFL